MRVQTNLMPWNCTIIVKWIQRVDPHFVVEHVVFDAEEVIFVARAAITLHGWHDAT